MNGNELRAPVKVGEEYDVRIAAIGEKGDGICRINGFVVFVPEVQEGDLVRIKVNKVLQKVGFGEVLNRMKSPVVEKPPHYEDTEDFGEEMEE